MCHCLQSTECSHKLCLSVANIQVSVNERSTKILWICVTGVSFFFFFSKLTGMPAMFHAQIYTVLFSG